MSKKTVCMPTHLDADTANIIRALAGDAGTSTSEWIRRLIMTEVRRQKEQAYANALLMLSPSELKELIERGERRPS